MCRCAVDVPDWPVVEIPGAGHYRDCLSSRSSATKLRRGLAGRARLSQHAKRTSISAIRGFELRANRRRVHQRRTLHAFRHSVKQQSVVRRGSSAARLAAMK